jgi:riboflavin synthase
MMFTGIIETVGKVVGITPRGNYKLFRIEPAKAFENVVLGESIAIDGCCLTVTEGDSQSFTVEASQETIRLSIAKEYRQNVKVNLERALIPSDRLGGHIVTGHVDCRGTIAGLEKIGESLELTVEYPDEYDDLVVPKGSIAINGISLTVNDVGDHKFTVNLIPYTREGTTVGGFKIGDEVNLEFDLLGKYIARMLRKQEKNKSSLSINKLIDAGW